MSGNIQSDRGQKVPRIGSVSGGKMLAWLTAGGGWVNPHLRAKVGQASSWILCTLEVGLPPSPEHFPQATNLHGSSRATIVTNHLFLVPTGLPTLDANDPEGESEPTPPAHLPQTPAIVSDSCVCCALFLFADKNSPFYYGKSGVPVHFFPTPRITLHQGSHSRMPDSSR